MQNVVKHLFPYVYTKKQRSYISSKRRLAALCRESRFFASLNDGMLPPAGSERPTARE